MYDELVRVCAKCNECVDERENNCAFHISLNLLCCLDAICRRANILPYYFIFCSYLFRLSFCFTKCQGTGV